MKALALVLGFALLACAGPTAQEPSEDDDDVPAAGSGGSGGGGAAGKGGSAGSPADAGAPRAPSPDATAAGGSGGGGSAGAAGRGGAGGTAGATGGSGGTMARDAGAPEAAPRPSDAAPLTGPAEMTAEMDGVMTAYTIKKAQVYTFGGAANLTVEGTNMAGSLIVAAKGMSAGTFPCGGDFYLSYTTARGTWSTVAPGGTCTITITTFGAVGEPIRGTFSGTLPPFFGVTGTKKVANGTFSAIRAKNNEG